MEAYLFDWLNLLGRWVHMITGIAWIGASFYFVWLDNHLVAPTDPKLRDAGVSGELWAVHGGGFYNPQKYRSAPASLPEQLHWFKWEAYTTWISGMFMLGLIYYAGAGVYLVDKNVANISPSAAIGIGLAALAGGWIVYDRLCASRLGNNERALALVMTVLLSVAAWGLCQVFSGRGAFIHFGAMLGTIMVANVFFIIIPGQKAMVEANRAGREPDPIHGVRGKQRSVHNTYFTLPVLFTMMSNHYPMTWSANHNWLVLIAISLAGAGIRSYFVARHKIHAGVRPSLLPLILGLLILLAVAVALRPQAPSDKAASAAQTAAAEFAQVQSIVAQRCASCHAATPSHAGFAVAPKGVMLESADQILAQAASLRAQLVSRAMPIGNLTNMTEAERNLLVSWIDRGAKR